MTTLTKSTIVQSVFANIYNRISTDVASVTLSDLTTSTIQTYTGSFPDSEIDTKSSYPICVINSPELSWENFSLTKKQVNGTFSIDIYTTKAESADLFLDAIMNSIETYRNTLGNTDKMIWVNLESTDSEHIMRSDAMKIHMRSATFSFKFKFTKEAGT